MVEQSISSFLHHDTDIKKYNPNRHKKNKLNLRLVCKHDRQTVELTGIKMSPSNRLAFEPAHGQRICDVSVSNKVTYLFKMVSQLAIELC